MANLAPRGDEPAHRARGQAELPGDAGASRPPSSRSKRRCRRGRVSGGGVEETPQERAEARKKADQPLWRDPAPQGQPAGTKSEHIPPFRRGQPLWRDLAFDFGKRSRAKASMREVKGAQVLGEAGDLPGREDVALMLGMAG